MIAFQIYKQKHYVFSVSIRGMNTYKIDFIIHSSDIFSWLMPNNIIFFKAHILFRNALIDSFWQTIVKNMY